MEEWRPKFSTENLNLALVPVEVYVGKQKDLEEVRAPHLRSAVVPFNATRKEGTKEVGITSSAHTSGRRVTGGLLRMTGVGNGVHQSETAKRRRGNCFDSSMKVDFGLTLTGQDRSIEMLEESEASVVHHCPPPAR